MLFVLSLDSVYGLEAFFQKLMRRSYLLLLGLSLFFAFRPIKEKLRTISFPTKFKDYDLFLLPLIIYLTCSELSLLWGQQLIGNNYTLAGVIPLADSKDYFQGAVTLNDFGHLSAWASRRPLNHIFMGGVFYWAQENHFAVFFILSSLIVLNTYVFSLNVYNQISKIGSFYIPIAAYYFYRPYAGSFLSESLGFLLSLASINFLFFSKTRSDHKIIFICLSILSLTIGLSARAGNFFAPFIIVIAYSIWGNWRKHRVRNIALMCISLIVGFSSNKIARSYFSIEGTATSNLGYTIYGIARGGLGWTQFSKDYPEAGQVSGQKHLEMVNQAIFKSLKEEPSLFFVGSWKSFKRYIQSYLPFLPSVFKYIEYLLLIFSIVLFRKRKVPYKEFDPFVVVVFGVLATNVLTSPILAYDGQERVYAATISHTILAFAFGFGLIQKETMIDSRRPLEIAGSCLFLLCLAFLASPLFFKKHELALDKLAGCEEGREVLFHYRPQYRLNYSVDSISLDERRPLATDRATLEKLIPGTNLENVKSDSQVDLIDDADYTLLATINLKNKDYRLEKIYSFPENIEKGFYQFCLSGMKLASIKRIKPLN